MKKYEILIITQYFWPESFKINDLAFSLNSKGHNVAVITGIPNYPNGSYYKGYGLFKNRNQIINNVKITRSILFPRLSAKLFPLLLNYISFAFFASLKVLTIKKKYDVIFVYEPSPISVGIPALVLKKVKKTPIIFWVTDLWPESVTATYKFSKKVKGVVVFFLDILVKKIYHETDKILVTSKGFIDSIKKKNVPVSKLIYFPQWAENIFIQKNANKIEFEHVPKNSFKILFAGNIGEAQDFDSILKAMLFLKNNARIHWIIVGSGRKKNWLKNKVNFHNLSSNVHILNSYPIEKMPDFYNSADCLLFSLKKEYIFSITVPTKVQTYLASGKPIIGMVDGEAANIIKKSKSGLISNAGDSEGLSENILNLSRMDKTELSILGKRGLKYYNEEFNREKLINKLEILITEVLDGDQTRSDTD